MARELAWYWRRLRAMAPAEVAHRLGRALQHPFAMARMRTGIYAPVPENLADWRGPSTFYFEQTLTTTPLSNALRERVERLCLGEREVLGLGWIKIPEPPWHVEPSRGEAWPFIDASRCLARAPSGFDARLTWELNRGHEWVLLARAWAATRDVRYRERLAEELVSWQHHNPLGLGINWSSAMEAAIRIHSLAWVAGFMRGEPLGHVAAMIHTHAAFVRRNLSKYSSANNHLLVELSALAVAARVLHGRADHNTLTRLDTELDLQVYSDGVNAEMATHYHMFVLEALLLVAHLERRHESPRPKLESIISKMADYIGALKCEDGSVLHQGDNDDGKLIPLLADHHPAQLIEAAAALAMSSPTPSTHEGVFWLTGGRSGNIEQRETTSRVFEVSGQVVIRSPSILATFDAGPFGFMPLAAHAHCDSLAVNVAVHGKPFLVDRGTYRYNGDPAARDQFRMSPAHNTLLIDDAEQAASGGPFLWTATPTTSLEQTVLRTEVEIAQATCSHSGTRHRRTVLHADGVLVFIDEITKSQRQATVYLHFAPGITPSQDMGNQIRATIPGVGNVFLRTSAAALLSKTQHASLYGASCQAATLSFRTRGGVAITVLHTVDEGEIRLAGAIETTARRLGIPSAQTELLRQCLS